MRRCLAFHTEANDVGSAVHHLICNGRPFVLVLKRPICDANQLIEWNCGNELVVGHHTPTAQGDCFRIGVHTHHSMFLSNRKIRLRKLLREGTPNPASSAVKRKAECGIGTPSQVICIVHYISAHTLQVHSGNSLPRPFGAHHLGRYGPHFKVVGPHEQICDSLAELPDEILFEVLRLLSVRLAVNIDKSVEGLLLVVVGQPMDIVLKWVRHPNSRNPHPRLTLQLVPFLDRKIHRIVEIGVVREDNMTTKVPSESLLVNE
mmetsp:Transcript_15082/g.17401  ORF Transcript_15082/g.17401 Transcript_15082/m.17401 type:complete len:261 (-) Transcript_15082:181-963(-)